MATGRWYSCPNCQRKEWAGSLFQALKWLVKKTDEHRLGDECLKEDGTLCLKCKSSLQLELKFDFALGAKGKEVTALASFLPDPLPEWKDDNKQRVVFYPFLVITEGEFGKAVWLPYFHVVGDEKPRVKYGQWAPYMGIGLFESLLKQARDRGFLE